MEDVSEPLCSPRKLAPGTQLPEPLLYQCPLKRVLTSPCLESIFEEQPLLVTSLLDISSLLFPVIPSLLDYIKENVSVILLTAKTSGRPCWVGGWKCHKILERSTGQSCKILLHGKAQNMNT